MLFCMALQAAYFLAKQFPMYEAFPKRCLLLITSRVRTGVMGRDGDPILQIKGTGLEKRKENQTKIIFQ